MREKYQLGSNLITSSLIFLLTISIFLVVFSFAQASESLNTKPIVTLRGENPTLLDLTNISPETIPDLSALAVDEYGRSLTGDMRIKSAYSGDDTYVLTYEVLSTSGVSSAPVTRTVNIKLSSADGLFLRSYLGAGLQNNPIEVAKLQIFLRDKEGMSEVGI